MDSKYEQLQAKIKELEDSYDRQVNCNDRLWEKYQKLETELENYKAKELAERTIDYMVASYLPEES